MARHLPAISGEIAYAFVRQLAFNTFVGNADAHAKNYSLLLRPNGMSLSPMYDIVPAGLYPQFDQQLAMRLGGARRAAEVTPAHWRKLARTSGLSKDRVVQLVSELATSLRNAIDTVTASFAVGEVAWSREFIIKNTEQITSSG